MKCLNTPPSGKKMISFYKLDNLSQNTQLNEVDVT